MLPLSGGAEKACGGKTYILLRVPLTLSFHSAKLPIGVMMLAANNHEK
jgi:hypothetical protein